MLVHRLRNLLKTTRLTYSCIQRSSSNLSVDLDNNTGIATMTLQRKPVNSLSLEFLTEMSISLEKLENDKQCQGLVLTSSLPNIFCAGLDIMEMYQCKEERVDQFWRSLQDVFLRLYGSKLATVAAISGHSPAGGCLLAMSCDYRIMAPNYTIGLNETKLGIVAPFWFKETLINTCGLRATEKSLQLGLMYKTDEALNLGLIDEVAPADSILSAAKTELNRWIAIPAHARQLTKMSLRKATIDHLLTKREDDVRNFVKFVTADAVQKSLGMYLESLKKKQ